MSRSYLMEALVLFGINNQERVDGLTWEICNGGKVAKDWWASCSRARLSKMVTFFLFQLKLTVVPWLCGLSLRLQDNLPPVVPLKASTTVNLKSRAVPTEAVSQSVYARQTLRKMVMRRWHLNPNAPRWWCGVWHLVCPRLLSLVMATVFLAALPRVLLNCPSPWPSIVLSCIAVDHLWKHRKQYVNDWDCRLSDNTGCKSLVFGGHRQAGVCTWRVGAWSVPCPSCSFSVAGSVGKIRALTNRDLSYSGAVAGSFVPTFSVMLVVCVVVVVVALLENVDVMTLDQLVGLSALIIVIIITNHHHHYHHHHHHHHHHQWGDGRVCVVLCCWVCERLVRDGVWEREREEAGRQGKEKNARRCGEEKTIFSHIIIYHQCMTPKNKPLCGNIQQQAQAALEGAQALESEKPNSQHSNSSTQNAHCAATIFWKNDIWLFHHRGHRVWWFRSFGTFSYTNMTGEEQTNLREVDTWQFS